MTVSRWHREPADVRFEVLSGPASYTVGFRHAHGRELQKIVKTVHKVEIAKDIGALRPDEPNLFNPMIRLVTGFSEAQDERWSPRKNLCGMKPAALLEDQRTSNNRR